MLISCCDESGSQQPRAILSHFTWIQFRSQVGAIGDQLCQSVYARISASTNKYHLKPSKMCCLSVLEGSPVRVCVCVCEGLCEKGDITVVHVCCCGSKQLGNHLLAYTSQCQDDEWTQLVKCMINYCYECWISCGVEVSQTLRCNKWDICDLKK